MLHILPTLAQDGVEIYLVTQWSSASDRDIYLTQVCDAPVFVFSLLVAIYACMCMWRGQLRGPPSTKYKIYTHAYIYILYIYIYIYIFIGIWVPQVCLHVFINVYN